MKTIKSIILFFCAFIVNNSISASENISGKLSSSYCDEAPSSPAKILSSKTTNSHEKPHTVEVSQKNSGITLSRLMTYHKVKELFPSASDALIEESLRQFTQKKLNSMSLAAVGMALNNEFTLYEKYSSSK